MNILINYDLESCTANISGQATLAEVDFATESIVSHFINRGVNKFECTRTRKESGACILQFKALKKSGPIFATKASPVSYYVKQDVFPKDTDEDFKDDSFESKDITDGQNKLKLFTKDKACVIETYGLHPNMPMNVVTYGIGSMLVGLFDLGVNHVKWQGSMKTAQLYFDHNITTAQINDFIFGKINADDASLVETLK